RPKSQNVFGELLREHGFLALSNGKARYWKGVGLLDQDGCEGEDAEQLAAPSDSMMLCPTCHQLSERQGTYLSDDGRARYWCPACRTCFYAPEATVPRERQG